MTTPSLSFQPRNISMFVGNNNTVQKMKILKDHLASKHSFDIKPAVKTNQ
jgi:hypothetical protein